MPIRIRMDFDVFNGNYNNFLGDLYDHIAAASSSKNGIPVIGPVDSLPWNWAFIGLNNGQAQICLLIRLENLYLMGWRRGLSRAENQNLFFLIAGMQIENPPPCFEQRLPFTGNYSGLPMKKICVTPHTISKAVDALYHSSLNAMHPGATGGFLVLILAFCASSRLVSIRRVVSEAFTSGGIGKITNNMYMQEQDWSKASSSFVTEKPTKCFGFGTVTQENASDLLILALWSSHAEFDGLLPTPPGWDAPQRGARHGPREHGHGQGGRQGHGQRGRQGGWQGGRQRGQWGQQRGRWGQRHAAFIMHIFGLMCDSNFKEVSILIQNWKLGIGGGPWTGEGAHGCKNEDDFDETKVDGTEATSAAGGGTIGRMRCLAALARCEELNAFCREQWTPAESAARLEMAMAANAAWSMGERDQMSEYVSRLDNGGDESRLYVLGNTAASGDGYSNGAFFRAVLLVRREKYDEAREYVDRARKCVATELAALVIESYERAYSNMVRVQQLSELDEVIDYCTLPMGNTIADRRRELIRNMWNECIKGAKRNVEVWQAILAVRVLVLPPTEDTDTWLKFASLCWKSGRTSQARSILIKLLQALMYPLLVACKSISLLRQCAVEEVVDKIRQHSGRLVDQAQLVSKELTRVAILWHEMWYEVFEESSYFGEHNIEGMLAVLEPLHAMLEKGAETVKEDAFIQAYGHELVEARECCMKYRTTGEDAELTQAWDSYYHVFRRIDKQLPSLTTLDLQFISPELLKCLNLELAVPGTYCSDTRVVTIASFAPQLVLMTSNQKPRKLTIHGSDGKDYAFLLKGHEDLCQDERVMQAVNQLGDANEVLNVRAVAVLERMSNKFTWCNFLLGSSLLSASAGHGPTLLGAEHFSGNAVTGETGRDAEHGSSVKDQVQNLILQARSLENLCQSYVGLPIHQRTVTQCLWRGFC